MNSNTRRGLGLATLGLTSLAVPSVQAQQTTLHGQVRPRYEIRDPSGTGTDEFTSMRVRLGLDVEVEDGLSIFIQAQDVRIWGEETHPLFDYSADDLDLHQGYLRYQGEGSSWLTTTVGRMETNLGGQRLMGAVDWTQQGQSFDGLRFDIDRGRMELALIGYTVRDETASGAVDDRLYGGYATFAEVGPGSLDAYWLYDRVKGPAESDEHTLGVRYGFSDGVDGRVEGTLQTGTRSDSDVSAFMFGARLGKTFAGGDATLTLWYDYLSGDDPSTPEVEVFKTLFGTNHKFYGLADLFLNIPAHTGGAGLQDMALKLMWRPSSTVGFGADLHRFSAAEQGTLSGSHFGDELDLTLTHRYSQRFGATAGFSYVVQDDPFGEVGRLSEDLTWFYIMLNATF